MIVKWSRRKSLFAMGVLALAIIAGAFFFLNSRPRTNVVLITLDTTRADRIGCYGHLPAMTPTLDSLAARGVLFERAYATCPVTLPSHCSMFTGLTPRGHGIHHNGMGSLDPRVPLLAEMLSARGYDTGAFVGAFVLNRKFGLSRGFQKYDDATGAEFIDGRLQRRRGALRVVGAALEWLGGRSSRPFFCWVHLFDPHAPYQARVDQFGQQFVDRPYDSGIALCDQEIGRILEFLRHRNLDDQTLIVVAGDHGEGLGEHGEREHGHQLYDSTLRVPLIFAHSRLTKTGYRVPDPVSLVDLMPTLADCLGLKIPDRMSGNSLRPALSGRQQPARPCYLETDVPFLEHHWAPQRGIIEGRWKCIRSPRPELYDLIEDPAELNNLAERQADQLQALQAALVALEEKTPEREARGVRLSAADRRSLASLGYVGVAGGGSKNAEREALPDIKDRLRFHEIVEDANHLIDHGRVPEARELLEKVLSDVPDYVPARLFHGETLAKSGLLDEARQVFKRLIQDEPRHAAAHARLAWVLGQLQKPDEALAELRQAADLAPDSAEFLVNLGASFVELQQPDEAQEMFKSALDIDPACANYEIGKILAASGDLAGAARCYQHTLIDDPNWVPLVSEVAILLARQKRFDEALGYAVRAVELAPNDANVHYNLGFMRIEQGQFREALHPLEQALRLDPQHAQARAQLERAKRLLDKQ
jgi:arylsulfatase A-like enzyme/Tfp pilus assembly protein PilF